MSPPAGAVQRTWRIRASQYASPVTLPNTVVVDGPAITYLLPLQLPTGLDLARPTSVSPATTGGLGVFPDDPGAVVFTDNGEEKVLQ